MFGGGSNRLVWGLGPPGPNGSYGPGTVPTFGLGISIDEIVKLHLINNFGK